MAKMSSNDGVQEVDVAVDIVSNERGGDDSVSADVNAQDTLTGAGTDQVTVSGLKSDVDKILFADRSKLFALFTAAKLFAEDPLGNLQLLQVDEDGNLKVSGLGGGATDQRYFSDQDIKALTNAYQAFNIGFTPNLITVYNDENIADNYIDVSFDNTNLHHRLYGGDVFTWQYQRTTTIYLKGKNGGEDYRLVVE